MSNTNEKGSKEPALLLDSSLITATNLKKYNIKVVDCGEYKQVYLYDNYITRSIEKDDFDLKLKKERINRFFDSNGEDLSNKTNKIELKQIEEKNVIRSKIQCQRLAKANFDKWETFITLTFEENITNIKIANKNFHSFITTIRKHKKDFSYIAIPEFQKRGAIHYHILTNISIKDDNLIFSQKDNPKFKHIKYWKHGFTSVEIMKGDSKKIVGYISKYMTKDIDNRLFGHRRYFYSQNLTIPQESYIDTNEEFDLNFYKKIIQDKELIYQNEYINSYNGSKVLFLEFLNHK